MQLGQEMVLEGLIAGPRGQRDASFTRQQHPAIPWLVQTRPRKPCEVLELMASPRNPPSGLFAPRRAVASPVQRSAPCWGHYCDGAAAHCSFLLPTPLGCKWLSTRLEQLPGRL